MPRIVEIKDQTPLLIRPEDTVNGVVAVCRCGLSSNWPFCNGTHKATIGEDPGKLYHYDRELPQGTPRRHEVEPGAIEQGTVAPPQRQDDPSLPAPAQHADKGGHGADATRRPPRPAGQREETPASGPQAETRET